MTDLKYTYALNSTKTSLVHIDDAREGEVYYCPYSECNERLIIKDGGNRRKHFSHIRNSEKCSYDNYLHSLAEIKIAEWFSSTNTITIELKTDVLCEIYDSCNWKNNNREASGYCQKRKLYSYDLKKFYNFIEIEKSKYGFRWDLWLTNTNKNYPPMAIEICVTHECEINKLESGHRIIEVRIENEKQLETLINSNKLIECDDVSFYNFRPKPKYDISTGNLKLNKFILYENKRAGFKIIDCNLFLKREYDSIYELTFDYYVSNDTYEKVFNAFYLACAKAYQRFPNFKHCSLCKHYKYNEAHNQYICILYKVLKLEDKHAGMNALTCSRYFINKEFITESVEYLSRLSIHEWIR